MEQKKPSFSEWYCDWLMPRYAVVLVAICAAVGPIAIAILLIRIIRS